MGLTFRMLSKKHLCGQRQHAISFAPRVCTVQCKGTVVPSCYECHDLGDLGHFINNVHKAIVMQGAPADGRDQQVTESQ